MKKKQVIYQIFDDRETAKVYAERSIHRNKRIARIYISALEEEGFTEGKILDAGCGSGQIAIEIALAFPQAEIVGIDLGESVLELARATAEEKGLSDLLLFEKGDVQTMSFDDQSFDVIISLNTFHVLNSPTEMLNEIERVLKPRGIFMISDIKRSWLGLFLPILRTAYSAAEAKKIIQNSKLRPHRFEEGAYWWGISSSSK